MARSGLYSPLIRTPGVSRQGLVGGATAKERARGDGLSPLAAAVVPRCEGVNFASHATRSGQ